MRDPWPNLQPSPAAYIEAARDLTPAERLFGALRPMRVGVLATFTVSWLPPYLTVEGARRGLRIDTWIGGYGQLEQPILDASSDLWAARPDVIVLATRLEDLSADAGRDRGTRHDAAGTQQIDAAVGRVDALVTAIRARHTAPVVVADWAMSSTAQSMSAECREGGLQLQRANLALEARMAGHPDVFVFPASQLAAEVGLDAWVDRRLEYVARVPFSQAGQMTVARGLARTFRALVTPSRKCLVLDLDGTLWGGVLGEDGPSGIVLGHDYPGRVFRDLQRAALDLRDRGILLAVASKNHEADVRAVMAEHPDMAIRWDDFAAHEVHWGDKAESLRNIARRLNIGLDALAFYDDSPLERLWVDEQLPEVAVLDVPDEPWRRVNALLRSDVFDTVRISPEDRVRAALYAGEQARADAAGVARSLDDFLKGLDIEVEMGAVDASTMPRVVQLISKTNQFNLTTRRRTEAELTSMLDAGAVCCWVRARDRFGDYGLVGVALAVRDEGSVGGWRLDLFLLSCRALGRQIEQALLCGITDSLRARGGRTLVGEYLATRRNEVAAGFFAAAGFERVDEGGRVWTLDLDRPLTPPPFVRIRKATSDVR